ncbi:hypothetical protein IA539_01890 [Gordonia sp. zg691]|uniref:Uncharacterized protein n=1 Tax=Gordonia jinghuaiqii TaxID=2758710 RepID=A0A7D7QMT8_9ACTN|nr:hypothetical protein [Gordonia jinghuaiqii]MBD0859964.1 hypothetical protein [Gordonia jinghuaiqii]MCR5977129.1 hypothetical protein [Gordonia jinghuaiqii]QMT00266.1 hypothetical protein H1R19_15200 [Gordonia jinghuaiqii]
MTHEPVEKYTAELVKELRENGVAGKVIGDAVAQVESHVAEGGDEPADVFGTPREFAKQLARGHKKSVGWPLYVASVILTVGGGIFLLRGIFGAIQDRQLLWGIPPAVGIIVGTLSILAWITLMIIAADPIKDPRRRKNVSYPS